MLNDDSSPRSPEELNFKIFDVTIESFSLSHIPVVDSDFLIEEVDTFLVPKDSMPPGIESDGYNSEGDNIFLEELLNNDSLSQPGYESFHFDRYNIPSSPRRPEKPPDDGIYLDTQPSCKSDTSAAILPNGGVTEWYQSSPPQFSVTQQPHQRSNKDMLLEIAKLIKNNRTLFNSDIFPHEEMSMRVLLAKERILKLIQVWDKEQIKTWSLPELLLQLSNDSQTINESFKQRKEKRIESEQAANLAVQKEQEELAAFTPSWKFPMIDDDEEYSIQYKEY
ncbi:hypothetical protein Tco_0988633 [Tanacetum coccineum]|uniref:Uncharacterized protein n=1 Tax=Tanacetum coccineum TaxID=301880 RepID=A0ABQ5ERW2_9ASTR